MARLVRAQGSGDNVGMGEFELLARLRERLPPPAGAVRIGVGDDAAVTEPAGATATSIDAIVEGVHFEREHGLAGIGHKALATALSDLAAMGAAPGEAYVYLGVPGDLDEAACLELLDGLLALAEETGTTLAGGDVTRAPVITLSVTVVGHAERAELFVTRGGAGAGDALVLSGEIGGAAAGLLLLQRPELSDAVASSTAERLRERQLLPRPRLAAGAALARAGATAMIDLSDGLAGDAAHLARESGAGLRIEAGTLPLAKGLAEVAAAAGRDPLELAVSGGEDYELLAAIPLERLEEAVIAAGQAGTTLAQVGEVVAGEGAEIRLRGGQALRCAGYDQLA
jgi:thiamine-monophosphate kinase